MQILCREARDMSSEGEEEDEEERLSQMIRDYIEFGSSNNYNPSSYFSSSKKSLHVVDHHYISLQEIFENVTVSEAEILGKISSYLRECLQPEKHQKKWITMRLGSLDQYQASLCTTSWVTTSSRCPSVFKFRDEYEYIEVMNIISKNEERGGRLIIDLDFRTQFELGRATETYKQLWNSLPDIFVGSEEKLEKIITLLCSAAKQSLRESGLHIPPWRKTAYMHSKWLSHNCKKISSSDLAPSPNP